MAILCVWAAHFYSVFPEMVAPDLVLSEAAATVLELSVFPAMVKDNTDELSASPSVFRL